MPIKWAVASAGHCIQIYCININKSSKTYLGTAEGDFKKRYNNTQNDLDTGHTQRKQHYLSIFGKLKMSIMKCQL